MDFIAAMGGGLWATLSYALPFLFLLCVVVFIHELGHFLAGRWCGVEVRAFSVGFGPEIFGFVDRYGTRWRFSAIPLGGYVKFAGDLNVASSPDFAGANAMTEEERRVSFPHKPVGQRAFIVAAGPIANFLLAIFLFAALSMTYGRTRIEPVVGGVQAGSAAESAGFRPGDRLVSIDGDKIETFEQLVRRISINPGVTLAITVERGGVMQTLQATPTLRETKTRLGIERAGRLGIESSRDPQYVRTERYGPLQALGYGVPRMLVHRRADDGLPRPSGRRPRVARPAQRRAPDRPGLRRSDEVQRLPRLALADRRHVGVDRPLEPVSDPDAGWRAPPVLRL